jgi:hypothetical protein
VPVLAVKQEAMTQCCRLYLIDYLHHCNEVTGTSGVDSLNLKSVLVLVVVLVLVMVSTLNLFFVSFVAVLLSPTTVLVILPVRVVQVQRNYVDRVYSEARFTLLSRSSRLTPQLVRAVRVRVARTKVLVEILKIRYKRCTTRSKYHVWCVVQYKVPLRSVVRVLLT